MENQSPFLAACRRIPTGSPPVWFMRQAGRYLPEYRRLREKYDLLTLCKTPELAAEITMQPVRVLNIDAAIIFSDLLLLLEPMGIRIHYAKGEGPVIENPIQSDKDVANLQMVPPQDGLNCVLSAISVVKKELKIPLIGFAGAPFTLASYLIEGGHSQGFLKTKCFMYNKPQAWQALMQKLTNAIVSFLIAQVKAGVDAVQIFDSWAGALSPDDYHHFALPYSSGVIRQVMKTGAPLIHFATGNSGMLKLFSEAGGDVIGIDWRVPLDEAWAVTGANKGIQGNLDPAALFAPVDQLKCKVEEILRKAAARPGHIFNLGHGVLPETPVDHVKYVIDCVKNFKMN